MVIEVSPNVAMPEPRKPLLAGLRGAAIPAPNQARKQRPVWAVVIVFVASVAVVQLGAATCPGSHRRRVASVVRAHIPPVVVQAPHIERELPSLPLFDVVLRLVLRVSMRPSVPRAEQNRVAAACCPSGR